MKLLWIGAMACAAAFAADTDFNGKWNIHVDSGRGRVWWLQVNGAGTQALSGWFVGAPGGQVDKIPEMRIEKGELVFVFRPDGGKTVQTYRARLQGGKLQGIRELEAGGLKQDAAGLDRLPRTGDQ